MPTPNSVSAQKGLLPWQAALAGIGAGLVYNFFGFFLWRLSGSNRMGQAVFLMFPLVVGATIALVTPRPVFTVTLISGTISLLICLSTLVAVHA